MHQPLAETVIMVLLMNLSQSDRLLFQFSLRFYLNIKVITFNIPTPHKLSILKTFYILQPKFH